MEGESHDSSNGPAPVRDSHQAGNSLQPSLDKLPGAVNGVNEDSDIGEDQRCQLLWYNKGIR